jgi:hypothetical protein
MATIGKFFDNFKELGFSETEINEATDRMVRRAFFIEGAIYGSDKDNVGGKWEAHKCAYIIFKNIQSNKLIFIEDEEIIKTLATANGGLLERGKTYEINGENLHLENKSIVWQPCYVLNNKVKDGLSKSFLLKTSTLDANAVSVKHDSDIHRWANANIVDGVLEKEWATKLATELNNRGMKVEFITYNLKRKDGTLWENKLINVHFAK